MNIAEAVAATRIHHQWLPDQVYAERWLSPDTIRLLEAKGHKIVVGRTFGSQVELLDGLHEGDVVAVYEGLTAGARRP